MNIYTKRFLVSFVAGAGSALGAAVSKTCWKLVQNRIDQKNTKGKVKNDKLIVSEGAEES